MKKSGFTLVELMVAAAILAIVLLGLLGLFSGCFILNETARNFTITINGAQEKLEQMRNHNFYTLVGDYSLGGSEGNTFTINPANWLAAGEQSAVIYILDPQTGTILNISPTANPGLDLYEIRITICWRQKGGRIFGEDSDLDGVLDAGEDVNGNSLLDSPVQLATLTAGR